MQLHINIAKYRRWLCWSTGTSMRVDNGEFLCHTAISALGIPSDFIAGSGIQSGLLLLWSPVRQFTAKWPNQLLWKHLFSPLELVLLAYRCLRLALVSGPILNGPATPSPPCEDGWVMAFEVTTVFTILHGSAFHWSSLQQMSPGLPPSYEKLTQIADLVSVYAARWITDQ